MRTNTVVPEVELSQADDIMLVAEAQRGDEACLGALYKRYYDRIYRFSLARLGNPVDAEDLAQETFLKMVDKLDSFTWKGTPFVAWLFRIAHNCVVDVIRRRARRPQEVPVEMELRGDDDPEEAVVRQLSAAEVMKAMVRLTTAQQEVLSLRFGAELSVNETARTLGKAEGTVKATQLQALQALRRILVAQGI